jgi:hypothetical protein
MEKGSVRVELEFNEQAYRVAEHLFDQFEDASKALDRSRDDNVFQQLCGKYLFSLRMQLEHLAKGLIEKYRSLPDINHLAKRLTASVNAYVDEFRQRAEAL